MLDTRYHFFLALLCLIVLAVNYFTTFLVGVLCDVGSKMPSKKFLTFQRILSRGPREKVVRAVNLFERNYVRDRGNN